MIIILIIFYSELHDQVVVLYTTYLVVSHAEMDG